MSGDDRDTAPGYLDRLAASDRAEAATSFPGLAVAEDLRDRTRAAILGGGCPGAKGPACRNLVRLDADLDHIRDALAGLEQHDPRHADQTCPWCLTPGQGPPCPDAACYARQRDRAWAGLQATAATYGVTPGLGAPPPGVLDRARAHYGDRLSPRMEAAARALDSGTSS